MEVKVCCGLGNGVRGGEKDDTMKKATKPAMEDRSSNCKMFYDVQLKGKVQWPSWGWSILESGRRILLLGTKWTGWKGAQQNLFAIVFLERKLSPTFLSHRLWYQVKESFKRLCLADSSNHLLALLVPSLHHSLSLSLFTSQSFFSCWKVQGILVWL